MGELTGGAGPNTLDASAFNGLDPTTEIGFLNNGRGIGTSSDLPDIRIRLSTGTTVDVELTYVATLQDVLDQITAASAQLTATLNAARTRILISDNAGGATTLQVTARNGAIAAADLGLLKTGSTSLLQGDPLVGGWVVLSGGGGADQFIGSAGFDTVVESRADSPTAVNMTLTDTSLMIGSEGTDWLTSIEQVEFEGSAAQESIDAVAFTLGPVTISTGGGTDTLLGGSENDLFLVDTSNLSASDQVTVDVSAGGADIVRILGLSQLQQSDLARINFVGGAAATVYENGNLTTSLNTLGGNITIEADTITTNGHSITTGGGVATAGNITLKGRIITIDGGSQLVAIGTAAGGAGDGAITITGLDENNDIQGLGFANVDYNETTITIGDALIDGGAITINATAQVERYGINRAGSTDDNIFDSAAQSIIGQVDSFSLIAAVSVATSKATITIGTDAEIRARDLVVHARADARAKASPTISKIVGIAVAVVDTTALVQVDGRITTSNDATFRATAANTANASTKPGPLAGTAIAIAVTVIQSDSQVLVSPEANLTIGGNLYVKAETIDRNRALATAVAGLDGQIAISIAVGVEGGTTNAHLDGTADVAGSIEVDASQRNEAINSPVPLLGYIPVLKAPAVVSGIKAFSATGQVSSGDLTADFVGTVKDLEKSILGVNTLVAKITASIKAKLGLGKPPTENKFDASGALGFLYDENTVDARIGDGVNGRTVEADGSISVDALVRARPNVSAVAQSTNSTETRNGPSPSSVLNDFGKVVINEEGALYGATDDVAKDGVGIAINAAYINSIARAYISAGAVVNSGGGPYRSGSHPERDRPQLAVGCQPGHAVHRQQDADPHHRRSRHDQRVTG